MKADNISFLDFIGSGKRTFCIPVYQRNYDWKKTHCITLFQDIENIAKDKEDQTHFLGTVVYIEGDSAINFREFTIIDGQQRLTSIMLLLKAIVDETDNERLKQEIVESYLTNRFAKEPFKIKLKPMKSDRINYEKLMQNRIREMGESQILWNYQVFRECIKSSKLTPEEIYLGIHKLEIVYIKLTKEKENPQLIFESLNSTGLDLTQADLIRNYLLMGQSYTKQEYLYKRYWVQLEKMLPDVVISDFIRDYLALKTGNIVNKDKVYESFKQYDRTLGKYEIEQFLEELTRYGEYYSWFKYCNCPDRAINQRLSQLQKLKSTVVYPFLLKLFENCYMDQQIEERSICQTIDILLSYVMRRLLCDMPTNALNKVFVSMIKEVEQDPNVPLEEKVVAILGRKKGKSIFPNDTLLKEKLLLRDCYKFPHIKYVLEQIERKQRKEIVEFDTLTIEHIMPQTLNPKWQIELGSKALEIQEKYVHRIGNLTLTGYNAEMSNRSFGEKKELYEKSNLSINRTLCRYENWGAKEIVERGNELFEQIISIWKCPDSINQEETKNDARVEFDIMEEVDVTGRTPCELELCDQTTRVDSWRAFFKTVCILLYEHDFQVFRSLVRHNDFKGRSKRIINDTTDGMRVPQKIAEGIYIEMNLSANEALNYSKLVVDKYEGIEKNCSYRLKPLS